MKLFYSIMVALVFTSCTTEPVDVSRFNYEVVQIFKVRPVSIHDEISPRYKAVLSNGDTVPASQNTRVGDTITFFYYNVHKQ